MRNKANKLFVFNISSKTQYLLDGKRRHKSQRRAFIPLLPGPSRDPFLIVHDEHEEEGRLVD
ncbi:MAG: hypothetical protein DMG73_16110 [Acidobacteria bacterium]|nr:MAG: hypothetical protein DMG73_16110 [Acidobacteriota bacterium]